MTYSFGRLEYRKHKEDVISLWERAYERSLSMDLADWLFEPYSENRLYAAFDSSDRIVGTYFLLKHSTVVDGKLKNAFLCNNVCIDPNHRGKNLFRSLVCKKT